MLIGITMWKEFTMEKQVTSEPPFDIVPLWMKVSLVTLWSFLGIADIWNHGFKSWGWPPAIIFLGLLLFSSRVKAPLARNLSWPFRLVFIFWLVVCCAWFVHSAGWGPALALTGVYLLSPSVERGAGWKAFLVKPQNALAALLGVYLTIWFGRYTGAWVPVACVALTLPLLEGGTSPRRRLRDNLRRSSFPALAASTLFAALWAWLHPSFGNVAGLVIVVLLVSSDIYLHTEEEPSIPNTSESRS
jgi:hypothetical protein